MGFNTFWNKHTKRKKEELKKLETEIEMKKKEIRVLKNKLREIERLLEETKLTEFSDYLREERKELTELKKMIIALDGESSFSSRIVLEERIENKIQALLNKSKEMWERIDGVLDKFCKT